MNFETKYLDELITMREKARLNKNWDLADKIRDYLDTKHIFVFDKKEGLLIYHRLNGSRQDLTEELKASSRAEKIFDAWLFSIRLSKDFKGAS